MNIRSKNILYFGYWGANEGLSQSTINPHLGILSSFDQVDSIIYVSIERTQEENYILPKSKKIKHLPFISQFKPRLLNKLTDFIFLPLYLRRLIKKYNIDLLMCRSSLAGGIGYLCSKTYPIPFTVESFEPHADYMAELGVWSKNGISYRLQKHLEKKQKSYAVHIMPVSYKYKAKLIKEDVNVARIAVMPCAVDVNSFAFNRNDRNTTRSKLGIPPESTTGIYIGKFGDIYWDKEAFKVFKSAFNYYENFQLILLSPASSEFIEKRRLEFDLSKDSIHHFLVPHNEVPQYLSAADLAFSFHVPSEFSDAFSPIKHGEYWANGLPIICTENIGDDSEIIENEKGGLIVHNGAKTNWKKLLISTDIRSENYHISNLARRYRSLNDVKSIYRSIILNQ